MFGQSHDPQTGAEPLLRMTPTFDNPGDQGFGMGAVFTGPGDDPGGGPFQIFLVGLGHMFRQGRMLPFFVTPRMAGNPVVFEQYFDRGGRQTDIDPLFDKLIGNAVVMIIHGNVVVDVDRSLLPLGVFIGSKGSGFIAGLSMVSKRLLRLPSIF